jgi:hypothetical protein
MNTNRQNDAEEELSFFQLSERLNGAQNLIGRLSSFVSVRVHSWLNCIVPVKDPDSLFLLCEKSVFHPWLTKLGVELASFHNFRIRQCASPEGTTI